MDEFYGGYNYTSNCDGTTISAAENIEDVDEDDVLIIDGLTKRFRLPGWRIAWIVGPKVEGIPKTKGSALTYWTQEFIKAIGSCGSYLDGGANVPFQEAAISMLEPNKVRKEMQALQRHFRVRCLLSRLAHFMLSPSFFLPPSHFILYQSNPSTGQTRLRRLPPTGHGLQDRHRP